MHDFFLKDCARWIKKLMFLSRLPWSYHRDSTTHEHICWTTGTGSFRWKWSYIWSQKKIAFLKSNVFFSRGHCKWVNIFFLLLQRLERCLSIVNGLTNGLSSERETNDALQAHVSLCTVYSRYLMIKGTRDHTVQNTQPMRDNVTSSSLIGWVHTQNDPWIRDHYFM